MHSRGPALVTRGQGGAVLEERASARPGPDELLVEPLVVGLCGTDLELIDGLVDQAYVSYPLVLGHEWVGTVRETRSQRFSSGDVVVVEGIVPCWACVRCLAGDTHLCATYRELGFNLDGAATYQLVVASGRSHRLDPEVNVEDGALIEPASVVYHALSRSALGPGLDCLVVGDGTIGLLALLVLKLWSPARLVMCGLRDEQRLLAEHAGVDEFLCGPASGKFDLVVEAAGTPDAVQMALASARRGGTVILLGLPPHGSATPIAIDEVLNGDLLIRASFGYSASAWSRVVRLVNAGQLRPRRLVTHRFALEAYAQALAVLRRPSVGEARGKVVLRLDHTS